tara:strand:+ start:21662 stop:22027 length:366 start_codon:yes stop_codon:yes gene_type:complete
MSYENMFDEARRAYIAQQVLTPRFVSVPVMREEERIARESEAALRDMEANRRAAAREARRIRGQKRIAQAIGEPIGQIGGSLLGAYEDELASAFAPSDYEIARRELGLPLATSVSGVYGAF